MSDLGAFFEEEFGESDKAAFCNVEHLFVIDTGAFGSELVWKFDLTFFKFVFLFCLIAFCLRKIVWDACERFGGKTWVG